MSIAGATAISATYRIGNGVSGNVGAEALGHVAVTLPFTGITLVRNPFPATGGVDPESIANVQQWAPEAFRAVQFRAATEADYIKAAQLIPRVQSAVASFRWTGSWYTVFIGILPSSSSDLINQPKGLMVLSSELQQQVLNFLDGYRLAGYDLEIRPPQFLPLEIDLLLCVSTDYFRSDVVQAVKAALSNQILPDADKGFFFLGNFVFGQPVYLSQIYSVVQAVEGVDSVVVTRFIRFGQPDNGELAQGFIPVGPWQIARLDNDPNFMERGVLTVDARGGKL
jgi:predicted phage baseplate assembly protein